MALMIIALCFVIFACAVCFYAGYYIKDIKGTVVYRTIEEKKKADEDERNSIENQQNRFFKYSKENRRKSKGDE